MEEFNQIVKDYLGAKNTDYKPVYDFVFKYQLKMFGFHRK